MSWRKYTGILVILLLCLPLGISAGDKFVKAPTKGKFSLERLHSRPFIFGTSPKIVKWASNGTRIAFLWNDSGERFFDLWMASIPDGKLARLTDMTSIPAIPIEDDTRTEQEIKDAEVYNPGIVDFDWSPDAKMIAFTYRDNLFLVPADGGKSVRRIIKSLKKQSQPRFSPDGKIISFVMDNNLWGYNTDEGSFSQLTTQKKPDISVDEYYWSPDGKKIAIVTDDISGHKEIVIPDYVPRYVEVNKRKRGYVGESITPNQIGVVARTGGLIRWLEFDKPLYYSVFGGSSVMAWAPDGKKFLVNYMDTFQDWKVYIVDADTLAKKEIYAEHQDPWFWRIITYWSSGSDKVFFTSENTGWRHIYSVPATGGSATQITDGQWDVLTLSAPEKGDTLVFSSSKVHPLEQYLFSVDGSGENMVRLTTKKGSTTLTFGQESISPDGKYTIVNFSTVQNPPEYYLVDNASPGSMKRLTHSPLLEFNDLHIPEPQYFTFKNKEDGRTLYGFMQLPKNFKKDKKYPVVIGNLYADSAKNRWSWHNRLPNFYLINELNYIIVNIDLRASQGYGKDFLYGYYKSLGVVDVKEMVSAAEYLKSLPYVDGKRIGLWGRSYGGFLTIMAMCTAPGVFNSGVSLAPVTDWHNYTDWYTGQRLGRPQEDEEVYQKTSPVFQVDGLQGNLLIMHGMQDPNVLFQDTVQIVQKFIEAGKYFDLMIHPLETHSFKARDEGWPDVFKRLVKYFEDHMGMGPQ